MTAAILSLLLLSPQEFDAIRALQNSPLQRKLRREANEALLAGPWSVTHSRPPHPGIPRNDYYSEGPYWWPDPANPSGPYIRRDGERNPKRFEANRRALGDMSNAVLELSLCAAVLRDVNCARRAQLVLRTWFVDPATRMNPHLEYGQAIPGRNLGRGSGIIDTVSFIWTAQAIALLRHSGDLPPDLALPLQQWFRDYLSWLTTSPKGLDEMRAANNHGTWWTAQVAAYSLLTGDRERQQLAWRQYRDVLLPKQIRPDGSAPLEEARTQSLSYSAMNLDGFSVLCRLAQVAGVDLWSYRTPDGIGIERAVHYLAPFVQNPASWRKQQISSFEQGRSIFLALAGLGLQEPELVAAHRKSASAEGIAGLLVGLLVESH